MQPEEIKHLEFLQNVITRMNSNSFLTKGWAITITSAIIGIFISSKKNEFLLIGVFVCAVFWLLDAFYLHQERKYRELFNSVRETRNVTLFDMDASSYRRGFCEYLKVVFLNKTITPLFLSLILFLIFAYNKIQIS